MLDTFRQQVREHLLPQPSVPSHTLERATTRLQLRLEATTTTSASRLLAVELSARTRCCLSLALYLPRVRSTEVLGGPAVPISTKATTPRTCSRRVTPNARI